jgi:hypothetical protein
MGTVMAYAPIHAAFFDHAKYLAVVEQDARAIALHFWAIAFANDALTDGFVGTIHVRRRIELGEPLRLADLLVGAGLWESAAGGYQIHDFLDYNLSAEQVRRKRAFTSARQARWRAAQEVGAAPAASSIYPPPDASTNAPVDALRNASSNPATNAAYASASASASASAHTERESIKQADLDNAARARPDPSALACLDAASLSDYEFFYTQAIGRPPDDRDRQWLATIWTENRAPPLSGADLLPLFQHARAKRRPAAVVCLELRAQHANGDTP